MKKSIDITILVLAIGIYFLASDELLAQNRSNSLSKTSFRNKNRLDREALQNPIGKLAILFEENKGQTSSNTKFLARDRGFNLFLNSGEIIFQLPDAPCQSKKAEKGNQNPKSCGSHSLTMKMFGSVTNSTIRGVDKAVATTGYIVGNDESRWINDVSNFGAVEYQEIYSGINLVVVGSAQKLEYDFRLAPQADPKLIQLEFDGAKSVTIDRKSGDLVFKFNGIQLRHEKPVVYQMINSVKHFIKARYVLSGKTRVGFKIGEYDKTQELIIDPVVYASYLGGTLGGDKVNDIAVDRDGKVYTASFARTTVVGNESFTDVMISKFDLSKPPNEQLIWVKFIGGAHDDEPLGMDVNSDGNIYVTGITYSQDFPMLFAEQTSHAINTIEQDFMAFVFKLHPNGELHYSTFLGGGCPGQRTLNYGNSIVADSAGNAYVTGYTCSPDFPLRNGFQTSLQGSQNSFLTKYDVFGHISYSTYFGNGFTWARDIFADGQGKAYITGFSTSGMYTTSGAYSTSGQGFVTKFNTNAVGANSIVYSTYVPNQTYSIVADADGNTWSAGNGRIHKLNSTGGSLFFTKFALATFYDIAIDRNGSVYYVDSGYPDPGFKVVGLHSDGSLIDETAFLAGNGQITRIRGIALGPDAGMVYLGGNTDARNFPTTLNAYQPTSNTTTIFGQGFFAKVQLTAPDVREPLIFVPGVSASSLDAIESDGSRTNLWIGLLQNHDRLTLDPNQTQANIIATDAIRTVSIPIPIPGTFPLQFYSYQQDAYRQILERLVNEEHYVEYQVNGRPSRRTFNGCDVSGQLANKPNLFVFAYDWRKSNIENAQALKEYVGCVRRFYPDSKVNILAHSMGGLLARRYIISNPNDHHVDKMVTIGSPWLGAPKAIDVIKTGNFGLSPIVWNSTVRSLGEFFKGMHELLPSRTYFDAATRSDFHLTNYGKPFKEDGWDVNGNGSAFENYDYDLTTNLLNQQQPRSNPGSANQLFHDTIGQDNWLGDTSGVKYFHIYGQQSYLNTTIQVIARYRVKCRLAVCRGENYYDVVYGRGDKTVPTISAERSFGPYYNLLPRNDKPFFSPNRSQDESVEHTKLTQNPNVQQEAINFLNSDSQQLVISDNQSLNTKSTNLTESLQEPGAESVELPLRKGYYVSLSGVNYVEIRDDLGNVNTPLDGGYMLPIPSVNYDLASEKSIAITTPTEGSYTLTFRSGNESIFLEAIKGMGNLDPTEAVRYLDLNLPANVNAQFQVSSSGITDLRYDSDGNGTFETSVLPTSHTTGIASKDVTPPTIQINEITQPSRQLTINASDTNSGVRKVYYSLDGTNFQEYLNPIPLTRSQSGTIYTFADDGAANRSLITTYTFVPIPDPVVTITKPTTGSVFPVGTSVNFVGIFSGDNCNLHTGVWTFDNISQAGTVNESNGAVTANYVFTSAGVYLVTLTVNNNCGGTGSTNTVNGLTAMIVIYDPDGGFVTGGGWIDSPLGAYTPNPSLTGRASFGFNSKYQRGANVPTGNTEFQFRVANFNFKSTSYDWLVVGGAKAQYKGTGTINNSGNCGFMLTAIDGQINGGGGQDKFRIKIWDKASGNIIYDNQLGSSDSENPATGIGGGSIIIHRQ